MNRCWKHKTHLDPCLSLGVMAVQKQGENSPGNEKWGRSTQAFVQDKSSTWNSLTFAIQRDPKQKCTKVHAPETPLQQSSDPKWEALWTDTQPMRVWNHTRENCVCHLRDGDGEDSEIQNSKYGSLSLLLLCKQEFLCSWGWPCNDPHASAPYTRNV